MPIKPENKALYGPCWSMVSQEVREMAHQRCQNCGVKNGSVVVRGRAGTRHEGYFLTQSGGLYCDDGGGLQGYMDFMDFCGRDKSTKIVLTVAHLDHDPRNLDLNNLRAWCQACHLRYDAKLHQANAAETRRKKLGNGELFQ